ncbi:hypothetical protein Tco_0242433 [Tanacetum coccineum]
MQTITPPTNCSLRDIVTKNVRRIEDLMLIWRSDDRTVLSIYSYCAISNSDSSFTLTFRISGYLGRTLYWSCHRSLLPLVGVATIAPPSPTKPKKGKAALPIKSDRNVKYEEDEEENGEEGGGLSQSGKELNKL